MVACAKKEFTAQQIVDESIKNAGLDKVANATISFDFRDKHYVASRKKGVYILIRTKDSVIDLLTNKGFIRKIHKKTIPLKDSIANIYANSVNSVHYFSVLPFGLNDKAVYKTKLPNVTINGKTYYKIQVTFSEENQTIKEGIRFVDFYNYKPKNESIQLVDIDKAFENKQLEKVSEIVLKNIKVRLF
jgi:hypothetical protein